MVQENIIIGLLPQTKELIYLNRGEKPHENIQFLLILSCVLKAIVNAWIYLRESAACVGNEHRLGANEAPPAIISVFIGKQLEDVLQPIHL